MTPQKIVVFGTGYVGCVSAACLANLGHQVVGIDRDSRKVDSILAGRSPFYEPGLDELIASNVAARRLTASADATGVLASADFVLICVGTPSLRSGDQDLTQLKRAVADIGSVAAYRNTPLIVVVRSTVSPGTCESIVEPMLAGTRCSVVSNPEFLREGMAIRDFMEPGLLVIGGADPDAVERVASLYIGLPVEARRVSLKTAEMIKYACNAFHAVKVAFANEVGALSSAMDVDGVEVMATLSSDKKLNASAAYLRPGFAFGGSCLPKDLRALSFRARQNQVDIPVLEHTLSSNSAHLKRATEAALDAGDVRLGIIGLAFKEDTDDLRESPALNMLEALIGKGRDLKVFDPNIRLERIHGANRTYAFQSIPHIGRLIATLEEVLEWADVLVVANKPSPEVLNRIVDFGRPVLDLVSGAPRWTGVPPRHSAARPIAA